MYEEGGSRVFSKIPGVSTGESGAPVSGGVTELLPIPEWKWEVISMDFIFGLPRTKYQHDYIMVVVDILTTTTHFIPVQSTFGSTQISKTSS